MSVDLTADEGETYDEEYQLYRDYVDSHEFDLWKEDGYAEFLKRTSYDPQGGGRSSPNNVPSESPEPPRRNSTRSTISSNGITMTAPSSSPRTTASPTTSLKIHRPLHHPPDQD